MNKLYTVMDRKTKHMLLSAMPLCDRHAAEAEKKQLLGYSLIQKRGLTAKPCVYCRRERRLAVIG